MNSFCIEEILPLLAGCKDKEPEQLSDAETLALAFMAGCAFDWSGTGYRLRNAIGIQKINGRFVVREARS